MIKMNMAEALVSIALILLTGLVCFLFDSAWYLFLLVLMFALRSKQ